MERFRGKAMADVTLTITMPDVEAEALAMLIASLGTEQFEDAYQHWLMQRKHEAYSPAVEINTTDLMADATEKVYDALSKVGFDVLAGPGDRIQRI